MALTSDQVQARIHDLLKTRLSKLGPIRAAEAWEICRDEFPYGVILTHFRIIMMRMRDAKKVDFVKNGLWFIHKNDKPKIELGDLYKKYSGNG